MIGFENKMYLHAAWLLPVMLLAFALQLYFQARSRKNLGEPLMVSRLVLGAAPGRRFLKFIFLAAGFCALVLALANPQRLEPGTAPAEADQSEIIFAVDVSNSMLTADILPDRLTRARSFLTAALGALPGTQVGLVVFAGKAYPYLPLTADQAAMSSAVKALSPNLASTQGSSLREALKISALLLNNKSGKAKTICLISDGESHNQNFASLADSLRRSGINVMALGIGTKEGDLIPVKDQAGLLTIKKDKRGEPVISKLNEENLLQLAGKKTDNYFRLETNETAVAALTSNLKKNKKTVKPGNTVKKHYYQHFLFLALVFLVAEMLIPAGKRKD